MKFAFICTNYNNSAETREAVKSLSIATSFIPRIIVVDNNSSSENVELLSALATEFSNVEVIFSKENVGYFNGLNLGIRRLKQIESDVDLVVVGNNDLMFPSDFVDNLKRNSALFEKYPVISPDIITLDGEHQNPHVISGISPFREKIYDLYYTSHSLAKIIRKVSSLTRSFTDRPDETQHEVAREIEQGYGACYILSPLFFKHFSELSAPTFMMHEEYFLTEQLREIGTRVYYEPSIKVNHLCHGAMRSVPSRRAWELGRAAHKVYRERRSSVAKNSKTTLSASMHER